MNWSFHHVGVGTTAFEDAVSTYIGLGYARVVEADDEGLGVRVAFLHREGHPLIEVVAPLGDDHPLKSLIKRRQLPSAYHTCYAVEDLGQAVEALRERGFMPLGEPRPAKAMGDALIVYLYGRHTGLLELVERPPTPSREAAWPVS